MFEFESVRAEYRLSYGHDPPPELRDRSTRLALEDIVELAQVNSREYQTAKESLYRSALQVTLSRFDYQLKFAPFGNGTDVGYIHDRTGGNTINTLNVATRAAAEQVLITGSELVARFANDVLLTFNGPAGFNVDVGSELLLGLSHSVFQRDIVFERLTQDERDVVYAARTFTRFRRGFFFGLAAQYYGLIGNYRNIEIATQNYFSYLRAFYQGEAEYQVGRGSRIQVDQTEREVLRGRRGLISVCNGLENGLDSLKIAIGLPTEQQINLNLTELEQVTLRDEITVAGELMRRARRNLQTERSRDEPDRGSMLNFGIAVCSRILHWQALLQQLQPREFNSKPLEILLARLEADAAELTARFNERVLREDKALDQPAAPLRIYRRTVDVIDSTLTLIRRRLELAELLELDRAAVASLRMRLDALAMRLDDMRAELARADEDPSIGPIEALEIVPRLVTTGEALLTDVKALSQEAAMLIGEPELNPQQALQRTIQQADQLLADSAQALATQSVELAPIELEMDEAVLTALLGRFDLMNQRGGAADSWRQIKLAGDNLKSILDLNATQSIRSRGEAFNFSWDDSTTRLSLSLDTPLNRRAQRNVFRLSLINYEVALRNLMELEDRIKFAVRQDLRGIELDRENYRISVAEAALNFERVNSVRLQLQLDTPGVQARDFNEAQQAYTSALSTVAGNHFDYITDRIQLFFDMELLEVDDNGFWPQLYDEQQQPSVRYAMPSRPPYGTLPRYLMFSRRMKRMLQVPPGSPAIYETEPATDPAATEAAAELGIQPVRIPAPQRLPPP